MQGFDSLQVVLRLRTWCRTKRSSANILP